MLSKLLPHEQRFTKDPQLLTTRAMSHLFETEAYSDGFEAISKGSSRAVSVAWKDAGSSFDKTLPLIKIEMTFSSSHSLKSVKEAL